jgi:Na+/alanine symporter
MEMIESIFGVIGDLTWGWALVPFLVVIGLFFTVATGFVQFTYFKRMFRVLRGKNQSDDPNAISAREALLLSVGGRVGGGNIAGSNLGSVTNAFHSHYANASHLSPTPVALIRWMPIRRATRMAR